MEDRKRSKSYPLSTPSEAFEHLRSIGRELGSGPLKREDAVKAMGYQVLSGTSARRFAALGLYGLIDGRGDAYFFTALGKRVFRPLPDEGHELIKEAFQGVEIFKAVLDEYRSEGALPNSLSIILERRFGIAAGSGDMVAKILRESAIEAGVISESGKILDEIVPTTLDPIALDSAQSPPIQNPTPMAHSDPIQSSANTVTHSLPRSGVTVTHPERISRKDLDRISKWLDLVVKPALDFAVDESNDEED